MTYTKQQIANFMDSKIRFEIEVDDDYSINYEKKQLTFIELERISKRNLKFWESIEVDNISSDFTSNWNSLNSRVEEIRTHLSELEELNHNGITSFIYQKYSNTYSDNGLVIYRVPISSPIDTDKSFRKIKRFIEYYLKYSDSNLRGALRNFISLSKKPQLYGEKFSSSHDYNYYPALYLMKQEFGKIKDDIADFDSEVLVPLHQKLDDISQSADESSNEITQFFEDENSKIQSQVELQEQYLNNFTENMEKWEEEKENKLRELEETYKNKLQLEEPEKLWNLRAENYRKKAKFWTYFLVGASIMLALIFSMLVWFLYEFPLDISKKIPFLSQSFFVVAIISFFIYIIRILVKLSMSNNHLAIEYEQKAAMTRFFQALTYDGESINENERLIIINSLFNKVDTGLVKTDGVEMENMLAILAKNLK
ncbi:DUF6161 domain-containing protein [Streptococcus sobrinus]|uniref:DUF6161 domain-containing protein n=2 Tax=Streptococcus sobrinus TaxID=1310 RepID=UPI0002F0317E|nr:DUF6161 domain-containing protein [Streptococcus sobrinus]OZV23457.1 hypothetical protein RO09_02975 [Streptococcus sobrinus]